MVYEKKLQDKKSEGGKKEVLKVVDIHRCIGCYSCMLACARTLQQSFSPARAALQIRTAGGFQSKFVAEICLGCIDAPCAQACHCGALTFREGGGVKFRPEKCMGCRLCAENCVVDVLKFDEEKNKPIPCIQCGQCVKFCPHEVIAMEERKDE